MPGSYLQLYGFLLLPYLSGAMPRAQVNRESVIEANCTCSILLSYEEQLLKIPKAIVLNANQSKCITVLIPSLMSRTMYMVISYTSGEWVPGQRVGYWILMGRWGSWNRLKRCTWAMARPILDLQQSTPAPMWKQGRWACLQARVLYLKMWVTLHKMCQQIWYLMLYQATKWLQAVAALEGIQWVHPISVLPLQGWPLPNRLRRCSGRHME